MKFNTDFNITRLSARDIAALMRGFKNGTLPLSTMYHNFREGEVLEDSVSLEDFKKRFADLSEHWRDPNAEVQP